MSGRLLSTQVSVPGDEWFTTYRLEPSLRALLEEAAQRPLTLGALAERAARRFAEVLLEKGLLVAADDSRQEIEETPHEEPSGGGVLLDELASKTTPTCVSNYLR